VRSVRPATARGKLYVLPFGFPGLVVESESIFALGTGDYAADARLQREASASDVFLDGGAVHGEVLRFDDPTERLPALDGLEGYRPGETSLYERVLIPTEVESRLQLAWAYALARPAGTLLPLGRWPA
jgi:gamma-glutamylcyclotransferase (GGCT)/AIG2-like uncharacterized protein YtfP